MTGRWTKEYFCLQCFHPLRDISDGTNISFIANAIIHTCKIQYAITILIEINFAWQNLSSDTFSLEHLFLRLAGDCVTCRIIFSDTTLQGSNTGRKTNRSMLPSFSSKIVLTRRNISLFEQGTLCLQLAHNYDNENTENRQCAYNHMQPVRKAGLTMTKVLSLGTQKSVRCPY